MKLEYPKIAAFFLSWFGMTAGVWGLFERAETVLSSSTKDSISRWLLGIRVDSSNRWNATFPIVIDKVYGKKLISMRSLAISTIISCISVAIFAALWTAFRPEEGFAWFANDGWGLSIFALLLAAVLVNALPDYVSLIQTRIILRWLNKDISPLFAFGLVFLDFVLTTMLIIGVVALLAFMLVDFSVAEIIDEITAGFQLTTTTNEELSWGVFFYTTYITSAWLWAYIVAGIATRSMVRFSKILTFLQCTLDINEKPLRSAGFVVMTIVTFIYTIVGCLYVIR